MVAILARMMSWFAPRRFRGAGRPFVRAGLGGLTVGGLLVGLLALGLRDRVPSLAVLSYVPVFILALALTALELFRWRWLRGHPAFLGASALLLFAAGQEGFGCRSLPIVEEASVPMRVVQQNVWWGGGRERSISRWHALEASLVDLQPDLLVLAELPEAEWTQGTPARLKARSGRRWTLTWAQGEPEDPNWYRVGIVSAHPHTATTAFSISDGFVLDVTVEMPMRPMRVWAVDGFSDPSRDRRRMLADVAARVQEAARVGRPVDILAGDFNAPAKSVGFDALRENYWLGSEHGAGWRATWPAHFPLIDVDHVWLRREVFGGRATQIRSDARLDHRGHVVDVSVVSGR